MTVDDVIKELREWAKEWEVYWKTTARQCEPGSEDWLVQEVRQEVRTDEHSRLQRKLKKHRTAAQAAVGE